MTHHPDIDAAVAELRRLLEAKHATHEAAVRAAYDRCRRVLTEDAERFLARQPVVRIVDT